VETYVDAPRLCTLGEPGLPALVWNLSPARRVLASTVLGGGLGVRHWIVNVQVDSDYVRTDPARQVADLARGAGCTGAGVGFLTAARVDRWASAHDGGVEAYATVGLQHPEWAASGDPPDELARVGTINLVVFVPVALSDAAMVNAVATATEAKAQALLETGVGGTGTASDALCIAAPVSGDAAEQFCGPRSVVGGSVARAVHRAVADGATAWNQRRASAP
jgi:adenosylcobinamide amidohydrolase